MTTTDTGMLPANPMMEALWWVHYRSKNKSVYNLTWAMTCEQPLDFDALRIAWQAMVDRHEALRGSLHQRDGSVYLSIIDHVDVEPERIVIADPGSVPAEDMLRAIAYELHERTVDLAVAPAGRLGLVTVGDQHELVLTIHHALLDGWSMQLLLAEFSTAYATVLAGGTPEFDTEPVSLREYVLDAQEARTDGRWDGSLKHWRDDLDGAKTATLIADRHRYTGTGNKGEVLQFAFSQEAVEAAASISEQFYTTPFTIILAALQTVIARGGAGPDVATGMVTANRMTQREQAMIGYVANLVVARNTINDTDTFGTVIERTRDNMWGMLANQQVPFSLVYGALTDSAKTMLRDNIPLIMTYYGPIGTGLRMGEVQMRLEPAPNRTARTDLGIGVWDSPTGFMIESEHNSGRYDRETVLRLFHDIDAALAAFGAGLELPVSSLDVKSRSGPAHIEHELTAADLGTTVMPKSAAMDQVRRVWTDVLGTEPAGPDEDFFAQGGRSLKVVQFASALESETSVSLDVVGWLADPTPRRAAEQIAGELDADKADGTVVELRAGDGPHVHLVPGAGGTPQDYRDLITELPPDWRITASQEREPLDSVPEMARRYRADLDAAGIRPDLLVGWSMGGQIAFELAVGYGDDSPLVTVIDSAPPIGYSSEQASDDLVYDTFAAGMAGAFGVTLDGTPAQTSPADPELSMRVLAGRLTAVSGQPVSAAMLLDRWRTFYRHTKATWSYVADRDASAEALVVGAVIAEYQVEFWASKFSPKASMLRVEADHYGVLKPPVVAEVAAAIVALENSSVPAK